MAELNVQPKKKNSIIPWILALLGIAVLIWFLTRDKDKDEVTRTNTSDTISAAPAPVNTVDNATANWNDIDFGAPVMSYDEVTDKNINVRGNADYGIYGLGENILFDKGQSKIRSDAEANLKQIMASISKRYGSGNVRVYGYTDSEGDANANKELAQQRADAVKGWLQSNGIGADRISVNAIGESQPVASNNTTEGREQNRRVEIVVRKG